MISCRGRPLTSETKKLVVSVKQYFERNKFKPIEPSTKRTADALGIGMATVKRIMADYNRDPKLLDEPAKGRGRPVHVVSASYQESVRAYIRSEKIILVCDNLNTHTRGAFYQAFSPETARVLARKIEFHYTPKHGSWLNIAENELSSLTRQCFSGRRIGQIDELRKEIASWSSASNNRQRGVEWQFEIDDARIKLKSIYPKILS